MACKPFEGKYETGKVFDEGLVLDSTLGMCTALAQEPALNVRTIQELKELRAYVERMSDVLQPLRGRQELTGQNSKKVLANLWGCMREATWIYSKYRDGWSWRRGWVTPSQIQEKVKRQTGNLRNALLDLQVALNIQATLAVAAMGAAAPETPPADCGASADTWEIPESDIRIDMRKGRPKNILGQGTFGIVGLATYTGDHEGQAVENMEVAVKMAHQGILVVAESDPEIVKQFKKEVKFMCTLGHPNVCACFGAVTHYADGELCMWIVMEKLEIDLGVAVSSERVPLGRDAPQQYAALIHGIVRALAYFHSPNDGKPIVHRDLKPANIMLDRNNVPKVIDFGNAKETWKGISSTMGMKGTPQWWAPEQRANGECSTASDMFAAGLISRFLWSKELPSHKMGAVLSSLEGETGDEYAKHALQLMHCCMDPAPEKRPDAASIHFELDRYELNTQHRPVANSLGASRSVLR